MRTTLPRARTDELLIEEFPDETLVYDLQRDRAHCLNRAASLVWRACDGRMEVKEMAGRLASEAGLPADAALVWMALTRLEKARLLAERVDAPEPRAGYSRRELIRALGLTGGLALLLPAVESIVAPLAASAQSCISLAACLAKVTPCGNMPICGVAGKCCKSAGGGTCGSKNC